MDPSDDDFLDDAPPPSSTTPPDSSREPLRIEPQSPGTRLGVGWKHLAALAVVVAIVVIGLKAATHGSSAHPTTAAPSGPRQRVGVRHSHRPARPAERRRHVIVRGAPRVRRVVPADSVAGTVAGMPSTAPVRPSSPQPVGGERPLSRSAVGQEEQQGQFSYLGK